MVITAQRAALRQADTVDGVSHPTDEALVASLMRRDQAALGELYNRHAAAMYGLALRMLGEAHAAQETVQDAFLKLWEAPRRFDPRRASLRAYLLVMVRSRALDALRRERPTLPLYDEQGELFSLPDDRVDLPTRAEQRQLAERLRTALSGLSEAHRETVERVYFGDQSREEIAQAMGVPVGTVKSRLKYALDKLRGVLGHQPDRVGGWNE